MVNKYLVICIMIICMIGIVGAAPTTVAAASITSNSALLDMTGGTAPMYFMYGQTSGSLTWRTPNSTSSNYTVYGSPLLGNTKFYYKACDVVSGCGNELSFTTLALVPMTQTTYGAALKNMTDSQFDIQVIASNSIAGYFWLVPAFPTIVWGLLFFGIYLGLWIRERDLVVPVILGLISGSFILFTDSGLSLGIPLEFQAMAQGLTYAAMAGIILAWVKRS